MREREREGRKQISRTTANKESLHLFEISWSTHEHGYRTRGMTLENRPICAERSSFGYERAAEEYFSFFLCDLHQRVVSGSGSRRKHMKDLNRGGQMDHSKKSKKDTDFTRERDWEMEKSIPSTHRTLSRTVPVPFEFPIEFLRLSVPAASGYLKKHKKQTNKRAFWISLFINFIS